MTRRKTQTPAPPPSPEEIAAALRTLDRLHSAQIETLAEARVLYSIAAEALPPTLAELTKRLKMPFSTASRVVFSLHQRGLLEYAPHPVDRRKKLLRVDLSKAS